jgi:hypothetical protein
VFLLSSALPAEAELICKRFRPSGPKVCWEASTGSVDCLAIAQGVAAKLAKDCDGTTGDADCHIVVTCSIYGTVPPYEGGTCEFDASAGTFPGCEDACSIQGQGICKNPTDHYNANGTAFNLPGPLTALGSTATCDSGGTCVSTATVTADGQDVCPNSQWTLYFTPIAFKGELGFCPGGFSNDVIGYDCYGDEIYECCTNDKRKKDGSCFKPYQEGEATEGEPGYIRTSCHLPQYCFDNPATCLNPDGTIKKGIKYSCNEI